MGATGAHTLPGGPCAPPRLTWGLRALMGAGSSQLQKTTVSMQDASLGARAACGGHGAREGPTPHTAERPGGQAALRRCLAGLLGLAKTVPSAARSLLRQIKNEKEKQCDRAGDVQGGEAGTPTCS